MLAIKEWLRALLALVALLGVLEMLLPAGGVQRFAKLVFGLVLMLAILQPLLQVLERDWQSPVINWELEHLPEAGRWQELAAQIQAQGSQPFLKNGEAQAALQIEVLLLTVEQIQAAEVSIKLSPTGIAAVRVAIDAADDYTKSKARQIVAAYLQLKEEQIIVEELEK